MLNSIKNLARRIKTQRHIEERLAVYKNHGMNAFVFSWSGARVPDGLVFPEGLEMQIRYMNEGLLVLRPQCSAVYERLPFDDLSNKQRMIVGYYPIITKL
jgi:hypothetical protein